MNSWVCPVCGPDKPRTPDEACVKCGAKVIYRKLTEPQLYVIKPEVKSEKDNGLVSTEKN